MRARVPCRRPARLPGARRTRPRPPEARPAARALRGRGFTLIELLVVVAIIALLISILLPSLGRARQHTRALVCESQLRTLAVAAHMYAEGHNGWLPEYGFKHGGGEGRAALAWVNTMAGDFGQNRDVLRCPADRSAAWTATAPEAPVRRTSYASNFLVAAGGIDNPLYGRDGHAYNRVDWIKRPMATILFVDLAESGGYAVADHVHPEDWDAFYPEDRREAAKQVALDRHLGRCNYAFVDGHAETLRYEQTYVIDGQNQGPLGETLWLTNKYDPKFAQ